MDFSFQQARKQVADGVSPTQARQLDKIRKVNDASNTFELIAKEYSILITPYGPFRQRE